MTRRFYFIALLSLAGCTTPTAPTKVAAHRGRTRFTTPPTGSHMSRAYTDDEPIPASASGVTSVNASAMDQLGTSANGMRGGGLPGGGSPGGR